MLHEHAITYENKISISQIDYMVRKANKLGKSGREVVRVHEESDSEGTHVYFDVTGLYEQRRCQQTVSETCGISPEKYTS